MPLGTIYNAGGSNIPSGAFALNGQLIENCAIDYQKFWNHITTNVDIYEYSEGTLEAHNKNWSTSGLIINANNLYGDNSSVKHEIQLTNSGQQRCGNKN